MKTILLTAFLIFFLTPGKVLAGNYLPCGSSTGNTIVPNPDPNIFSRGFNVSVGASCEYLVPDMRFLYISRTGRGWRQSGTIQQVPAPGTRVVAASGGCIRQFIRVNFSVDFHYNNGTPINPRDDRYCSVDRIDSFLLEDKIAPVARSFSFTTSNTDFNPASLKANFISPSISDNCTPLSILQDNLQFVNDPRRPAQVGIRCGSTNTYRVSFRTSDACGRLSNWAIATIRFVDGIAPSPPTIISPSYFYTNNTCRSFISPSMLTAYSHDDYTPDAQIRYSYRIISPAHLRGDIPASGRWLNAAGACPVNGLVTLRVCAQDCSGNGNLHVGDNILDANCDFIQFNIRDTIRPILLSECGNTTVNLFANCTNTMPNLASTLSVTDNCSAVSIYQLPAPGSILNDGVGNELGLASGSPRSFTCTMDKEDDDYVDCTSSTGIFKSIPVSFILVDCDGNCTIQRNCIIVNLTNTINNMATGNTSYPLLKEAKTKWSSNESTLSINNQPNPFQDFTDIKIKGASSGKGILRFYTSEGRTLHHREVKPGEFTQRIQKQDLNTNGLVFYTYSYRDDITGEERIVWNKMLVY